MTDNYAVSKPTSLADEMFSDDVIYIAAMMTFMIMMLTMVGNFLNQQQAHTQAQGIVEPGSGTATSQVQEFTFTTPMSAVTVNNKGSTPVLVKVNTLNSNPLTVGGESSNVIDMGSSTISRVFYYTMSGQSPVEIIGVA